MPYKGMALIYPDMLAGRIDFVFDGGAGLPYVQNGTLALLAQTSARRMSLFPDTPTMIEGGIPGFAIDSIHLIMVPGNTPKYIV